MWVQRMKKGRIGNPREIRIGEDVKNMVGVRSSLLGNILKKVRMRQSQINFNSNSKMLYTKYNHNLKCSSNIKPLLR